MATKKNNSNNNANQSESGGNSKNLKFRLNLSFENFSLLKNRNNIILNLPFFWISGRVV